MQAIYQIAILLIFNFSGKRILRLQNESPDNAEKMKNTFIFNTFVFCQVGWMFSDSITATGCYLNSNVAL